MYRPHQGATALPVFLDTLACGPAAQCVPQVSASASRDAAGRIHLSLCNLSLEKEAEVESEVRGVAVSTASGRILTDARMNAHNTFEQPEALGPVEFDGALLGRGGKLTVKLPAKAVVMLELG
jgi:alpha-N-arabinofuranosidase